MQSRQNPYPQCGDPHGGGIAQLQRCPLHSEGVQAHVGILSLGTCIGKMSSHNIWL